MKVKGWRNIKLLGATSFLTDVSSEIMHSVLPFFIVSLGGGGFIVGVIGGLGDVISNIFKVISGYISDKIRRCKSIVALGYFTSSLSKLLLSFSTSWLHVMVIRPIERIGKGIRTAPRDALIAASIDESQRGRAFGLHRALDTAGAILGVILAIALLKFLGEAYNQILLIAGIIAFTALIPLAFVEEARMEKKRAKETAKIPLRTWIVVITMTIFAVGNFTYMLFLLRGESFFTGEMRLIGPILLYLIFNILYTVTAYPAGALADRIGKHWVTVMGYVLYGISCLGLAMEINLAAGVVMFILYGASYGFFDGVQRALISDLSPLEARGTVLGVFHSLTGFGTLAGSIIAGLIWETIRWNWTFIFGAVLALASALTLAVITVKG